MFLGLVASLIIFLFSTVLATFPGERTERLVSNSEGAILWRYYAQSIRQWMFHVSMFGERDVDEVLGRPLGFFSNTLVLTDQTIVDIDKLDKVEVSRSFRGRDLRFAVFNRADLRKADLTGAVLDGAQFIGAKLNGAQFKCAKQERNLDWSERGCTSLNGGRLFDAQLQGANLEGARLESADLDRANLREVRS